jgi:Fe-S cluster assembly protein SufD
MTIQNESAEATLTQSVTEIDRRWSGQAPAWLSELRRRGLEAFHEMGLPGPRDEEWRQTRVKPIVDAAPQLPDEQGRTADPTLLEPWELPGLSCWRLTLVDGRVIPELSELQGLPTGVTVGSLRQAVLEQPERVEPHLGRYARLEAESFTALNTAYLEDGAYIHVPAGVSLDRPIHLLVLSSGDQTPRMTHPRTLIVAEAGSNATLIEQHAGPDGPVYFSNAVTEAALDRDARFEHVFLQRESAQAFNVSTLQAHQGPGSDLRSHSLLLGGRLVRNNVNPVLDGENAHSLLNGLYLPDGQRLIDNHMRVHHRQPDCQSRQFYTGVLREKGRGVFVGRIVVDRPAQRTDAVQNSRCLLLGEEAHAHNRPQLEIFADDVKCTHGATVGEIDEESLFYLRSRGIDERTARGMMIFAFASEALQRIEPTALRQHMVRLMSHRLGLPESLQQLLGEDGVVG